MAAPAAPAAVQVVVPLNPTDDSPVILEATEPVVMAAPYLPWLPRPAVAGAPAQVSLATHEMLYLFSSRCQLSRTLPIPAAISALNPLTIRLSGAGWTMILTELEDFSSFCPPA